MSVMLLASLTSLILTDTDRDLNSNTKSTPDSAWINHRGTWDEISLVPRKTTVLLSMGCRLLPSAMVWCCSLRGRKEPDTTEQLNWMVRWGRLGWGQLWRQSGYKEESRTNNFREMFSKTQACGKREAEHFLYTEHSDYLKEHYSFSFKNAIYIEKKTFMRVLT